MTVPSFLSAWRRRLEPLRLWLREGDAVGRPGSCLSNGQRLALLAGFVVLVLLRLPQATWSGRFLDEEGPIFLAYAWHRDAWDALWRSFGGYLNLGANASTLLTARMIRHGYVTIEHAPRVTMAIALAFQALPAALVLWGRGVWLNARWSVIATLLMIVLAPLSEEVWLNVLHIQYHLALCCALILVLDCPVSVGGWIVQGLILLLAPLCGPGAMVLGPLFLLRSALDRSIGRLAQTAILGAGSLIQMLVFFTPSPVRGQLMDIPSLATVILVRLGVLPTAGIRIAWGVGDLALFAYKHGGPGWWIISGISITFCAALAYLIWRHRHHPLGWLIAAGLGLAAVSFGGGMINARPSEWFSAGAGERYNFIPLVLLGIAVVVAARDRTLGFSKKAGRLCGLMLFIGAASFFFPIRELSQGPDWQRQSVLWQQDHNHPLLGWPETWPIDLSDTDRACPKPSLATASIADPGYCESAWLARVLGALPPSPPVAGKPVQ